MSKKVLLLLAEGFEEVEAFTPLDALVRAGAEVICVGVTGKSVKSSHGVEVVADMLLEDAPKDADLVFLPGGMPGSSNLAQSWPVNELIINMAQKGIVAAICAAPAVVLGPAGLLSGHEATCYPGCENYFPGFNFSSEGVVVSGNIITAKAAGCAWDLGLALVEALYGKEAADKVASSVYYSR